MGDSGGDGSSGSQSQPSAVPSNPTAMLNMAAPANIPLQGPTPQNQGLDSDANPQVLQQLLGWQPLGTK